MQIGQNWNSYSNSGRTSENYCFSRERIYPDWKSRHRQAHTHQASIRVTSRIVNIVMHLLAHTQRQVAIFSILSSSSEAKIRLKHQNEFRRFVCEAE